MAQHIVHLVHGTWGNWRLFGFPRKPRWFELGHPCRSQLETHLGSECEFSEFSWSWGPNLQVSRMNAAERLTQKIWESDDDTKHTLIGHSHGGNICLESSSKPEVKDKIERVITLSTPFICLTRSRSYPWIVRSGLVSILIIVFSSITAAMGGLPSLHQSYFTIFCFTFAVVFLILRDQISHVETFSETSESVAPETSSKVTIFRTFGDEASGLLGINSPIYHFISRYIGPLAEFYAKYALPAMWILFLIVMMYVGSLDSREEKDNFALPIFYVASFIVYFFAIVFILSALLRAGFGWDLAFVLEDWEISAEATPGGCYTVYNQQSSKTVGEMSHSQVYTRTLVVAEVIKIISGGKKDVYGKMVLSALRDLVEKEGLLEDFERDNGPL